ncbi:MAG: CoA-binding protein, partial [Thiolinea sp.]
MSSKHPVPSTPQHATLDSLLTPETVALVGVSPRPDSYGYALYKMCTGCGFSETVYLVNPGHKQIDNQPVYPSLSALPESPELVVISVGNDRVYEVAQEALDCGAKALVVFAEMPDAVQRQQLTALVREAGAVMCGPNSMGLHNLCNGLRLTPFPAPTDLIAGGIGLIVQSGSIMGALVHNDRRLRFSHVVSTGSETITTAADYLYWMASRPETRCVGLFLETVRDPARFIAAMELAAQRNIPVVIMKVGRSAKGAAMAITHTGALVGNDAVFRAL